ncbi:MAG: polysaccharide deacetylase family protein, partial [Bacteroidota bacterium]|nr:polysaccharide deacetylase family protein [Bacteroidota bacterium]
MILIYCSNITNRIRYVFNLILKDIIGIENIEFTTNEQYFCNYTGPKISYHSIPLCDELFFLAKPLLFEKDIRDYSISVTEWEGHKIFFPTNKISALPFDPFSAAFFLLTRYEEYLPHIKDQFQRFPAEESLAFQNGFLEKPVINHWAEKVKCLIRAKYPELKFLQREFKFISTIDIDNAFAFKEKGFVRTAGAITRAAFNLRMEKLYQIIQVLLGNEPDPFDTYEYQLFIQKKYKLSVIYFILLADYGVNDKNIPVQSRKFQALIKSMADYAEVGIHPGFNSNKSDKKLRIEHNRLQVILKREVTKSRQHFLKLVMPETYRNLINLDITDDYTMGFSSRIGFRAGTCSSFNFYDLDLDIETKLKIHPFSIMDASLKYNMQI